MALQAYVGSFMSGGGASGTTVGITGVGFEPEVVLLFGGSLRTSDASGGSGDNGFFWHGAMDANGNQFVLGNSMQDGTANSTCRFSDQNCVLWVNASGGAINGMLAFASMDADGFTLRVHRAFSAERVTGFIALRGLSAYKVGTFTSPVATGVQSVTDPGFKPDTLMLVGGIPTTSDLALNNDVSISLGFVESDGTQGCGGISRNDGADTASSHLLTSACLSIPANGGAGVDVAEFSAFSRFGFDLNWTTTSGSQRKVGYVALQGADIEVVSYTSPTDTSTTSVVVKAQPVGSVALHITDPGGSADAVFGFGFSSVTAQRGFFFRTLTGECVEQYQTNACICGSRTPGGPYDSRFTIEIEAWDANSADLDVLTNDDSDAVAALLFFLSEKAAEAAGPNFRYVPVMAGLG
jgi:hypothetical protein